MKLILGSQSKGRAQILKNAGYDFTVMHASIDEKAIRSANYEELPLLIARAKAQSLLPTIQEHSLLITADLVVVCDGELREKPESLQEAERYLHSYSKNSAKTITAVVITDTASGRQKQAVDIATVYFRELPQDTITSLLQKVEVMNTAGALIVEDPLISPSITRIEGTLDSVIGLPMNLLKKLLAEFDFH